MASKIISSKTPAEQVAVTKTQTISPPTALDYGKSITISTTKGKLTVSVKRSALSGPSGRYVRSAKLGANAEPIVALIQRALTILGSPHELSRWMQTAVPSLNGQTPYSMLQTEEGQKQVETVLGRIEHGIY